MRIAVKPIFAVLHLCEREENRFRGNLGIVGKHRFLFGKLPIFHAEKLQFIGGKLRKFSTMPPSPVNFYSFSEKCNFM